MWQERGQLSRFDPECFPAFQAAPLCDLLVFDVETGSEQMSYAFQGPGWGSGPFPQVLALADSPIRTIATGDWTLSSYTVGLCLNSFLTLVIF